MTNLKQGYKTDKLHPIRNRRKVIYRARNTLY